MGLRNYLKNGLFVAGLSSILFGMTGDYTNANVGGCRKFAGNNFAGSKRLKPHEYAGLKADEYMSEGDRDKKRALLYGGGLAALIGAYALRKNRGRN